jgi:hypothetical protein
MWSLIFLKSQTKPHPPHTCWDVTMTKLGEKKEYTPFLAESKSELSIGGLAQLADILWAMDDSLPGVDSYS